MPTRNEMHDPVADAVHDRHAAERERLGEMLHGAGPRPARGKARRRMQAAFDAHHLACLATFKTRHATVQEYARWRFQHWAGGGDAPVVDFEVLGSVEEADQLYQRLQAEARTFRMSGLPVGQPPGMTAFSGGGDLQFWRQFEAAELPPGTPYAHRGVRVLVTVSGRDGVWHVCFMQDWTHMGATVSEVIEDLATSVYRHALAQAGLERATRGGVRGWLGRLVPRWWRGAALRPGSMRFYEHRPPRWLAGEEFAQVRMRFRHGRFGSPSWERYEVIPASLAAVRRAGSRHAKTGLTDVIPDLPNAGCDGPLPGCLSPNGPRTGEQASKGTGRRVRRFMAEPALIAAAALAGALFETFGSPGHGNNPVLGAAGAMAALATMGGLARFMFRSYRAGTKVLGGFAIRAAAMVLCVGFEVYGFICWCDDVSQVMPTTRITFE